MSLRSNSVISGTNNKPIINLNPPDRTSSQRQFYNSFNRNLFPILMGMRIFGLYFYPPTSAKSKHEKGAKNPQLQHRTSHVADNIQGVTFG